MWSVSLSSPLHIFYDASILGAGAANPLMRTGIFRVVEEVMLHLATLPEIELSITGRDVWVETAAYLEVHGLHERVWRPRDSWANVMSAAARQFRSEIATAPENRSLYRRARRYGASALLQFLNESHSFINAEDLRGADIYHSPHAAIPAQVRRFDQLGVVLTVYDLIPLRHPEFFLKGVPGALRKILGCLQPDDFVAAISESTKNDLCEMYRIDPHRVTVTPLAASREVFFPVSNADEIASVRARYGIPEGDYILSLCTLEPRKNLTAVVKAFAELRKSQELCDTYLVLVGSTGWHSEALLAQIQAEPEIQNRIVMTGFAPDEDLAALYSGASLFVYVPFCEGFGLPPLEAMQCGTPVITSNTSSLPEVVGDAGITVDPANIEQIAGAMLSMLGSTPQQAIMRQRSLARAAMFSWERCAAQTFELYKMAVKR